MGRQCRAGHGRTDRAAADPIQASGTGLPHLLGSLSLERRYGRDRLEADCALALSLGTCKYRHVHDILHTGRDQVCHDPAPDWTSLVHAHVRGPVYYQ